MMMIVVWKMKILPQESACPFVPLPRVYQPIQRVHHHVLHRQFQLVHCVHLLQLLLVHHVLQSQFQLVHRVHHQLFLYF